MLRSFDYAAHNALRVESEAGLVRPDETPRLESWAVFWTGWVSAVFLTAYLGTVAPAGFLPKKQEDMDLLLRILTLEKAIYETGYELNNRPDWVSIPIRSINRMLKDEG